VSGRWQDDPARAERVRGLLAEVAERRLELRTAVEEAQDRDRPSYALHDVDARVRGATRGLDAAVGMAVLDGTPPPDDDIADAAGIEVADVDALRARLRLTP
jgi:hypothetical protein